MLHSRTPYTRLSVSIRFVGRTGLLCFGRVFLRPEGKTRNRCLSERNMGIRYFSKFKSHSMRYLALRDARRPLRLRTVDSSSGTAEGPSWSNSQGIRLLSRGHRLEHGQIEDFLDLVNALNIVRSKISSARAFRSSQMFLASFSVIQVKSSFFTLKMTTLFTIGTPWSSHP